MDRMAAAIPAIAQRVATAPIPSAPRGRQGSTSFVGDRSRFVKTRADGKSSCLKRRCSIGSCCSFVVVASLFVHRSTGLGLDKFDVAVGPSLSLSSARRIATTTPTFDQQPPPPSSLASCSIKGGLGHNTPLRPKTTSSRGDRHHRGEDGAGHHHSTRHALEDRQTWKSSSHARVSRTQVDAPRPAGRLGDRGQGTDDELLANRESAPPAADLASPSAAETRARVVGGTKSLGATSNAAGSIAAVRREAFKVAGLPAEGPHGALGQRAGAGGAGVEAGEDSFPRFETQQQQQHQYEQQGQGDFEIEDRWEADIERMQRLNAADMSEGLQEPIASPRTPLQEQVYQTQYRHHNQIPGQAVGTQQRASSLFRRAGGGGVFFVFFLLVWRSLSNYEQVVKLTGALRGLMVVPALGLFVGNLVCMCLALVQAATARQKARMKTMLTVDAAAEGLLLLYNLVGILGGQPYTPREEFISRVLANAWFLSICFTFARARWVADGAY